MTSVLRRGIIGENVVKSGWSPSVRWETCTRSTSGLVCRRLSWSSGCDSYGIRRQSKPCFISVHCPVMSVALPTAIRAHWGIENQLHWVLDVTFGEDACRIRTGHGPDNFALLRRLAISVLNQETSKKRSLRQKSKRAAMSPDYMLTVLTAALPQ